ncbi:hypothetical protein C6P40_000885 [Pichia californica]|uniref:Mitochondrial import inner membrane translocase subunit TIM14 n=1 Tax=Pichia californica TaxID=460514 RepID=A0A9P6WLU0_9ASCO|nr:hypothetical protein C6P42_004952 [[Candida] californica]KAG0688507.1 hypothetical protein C6P40_000885 [[Candida] californica]
MVLPIIIGLGITIAALTAKATINTVTRCSKLNAIDIAKLNGIKIEPNMFNTGKIWPIDNIYWRKFEELDDQMHFGGFNDKMNRYEALEILGFSREDAFKNTITWEDIRQHHRKMMMSNHPDKGGSKFLAMKINTAKEILEKEYKG